MRVEAISELEWRAKWSAERVSWCSGVTLPVTRDKVMCLVLNRDETYQGETVSVCFRSRRYSRGTQQVVKKKTYKMLHLQSKSHVKLIRF